jgi:microcystin-dependent protein
VSIIQTDNFFPFDTGTGALATPARWRLMARQWSGSGVIPNYPAAAPNMCRPTLAGSVLTIDPGAVWIDGFYGESTASKSMSVSGGDGLAVARADPTGRQVVFAYVVGQSAPTQTLTDIYEIPIARVTSGALVDIRQYASGGQPVPPGAMMDFAGGTAPAGWLLCNGASYLKTDFPALSSAIGNSWGGAGLNFNVPDLRGRVPLGSGAGPGLSNRSLAASGGEENHTLSSAENGYHNHQGATGTESAWHQHGVTMQYNNVVYYPPGSSESGQAGGTWPITGLGSPGGISIGNQNALHTHGVAVEGGAAHNNMPPFVVVTKVIKT